MQANTPRLVILVPGLKKACNHIFRTPSEQYFRGYNGFTWILFS